MRILWPKERYSRLIDIVPQDLAARGIRGLILDVDNTMAIHDHPAPFEGVAEWLDAVGAAGLRCVILSNNSAERVMAFARTLSLEFEAEARKPFPGGFWRACRRMGVPPRQAASIGDQLFTDTLGANLAGVYSILVDPAQPEGSRFFAFKRRMERPVLTRFERRKP